MLSCQSYWRQSPAWVKSIKIRTTASDPEYDGLIKKQVAGGWVSSMLTSLISNSPAPGSQASRVLSSDSDLNTEWFCSCHVLDLYWLAGAVSSMFLQFSSALGAGVRLLTNHLTALSCSDCQQQRICSRWCNVCKLSADLQPLKTFWEKIKLLWRETRVKKEKEKRSR